MKRGTLIVFVKAPQAGRAKTRLGREIGMGRAAALFRIMTKMTLRQTAEGRWRTALAVDPPSAIRGWEKLWPEVFPRVSQGPGDLGARMERMFRWAPPGPVVIIGADAPGLRARHIRQAFSELARADAVFGPAEDGGYWLIGLARRKRAPHLFENVRWSCEFSLQDTLNSLPPSFSVQFLETLRDVDVAVDLDALQLTSVGN
ncbi:MAG: TIGR04282 family arsenosugar biosynthesis glycosyltransferase [Parvularculaceae bacterium]